MSKRSQQFQGGEERYGGSAQEEMSERPLQATAAQLAKRKIAQAKGTRRPRSESPMPSGSIFDQATQNGFLSNNSMPPSNPFASATGFSFNNNANANGSSQSFGSGGGSFTFGTQTQQSTPNTNASFNFGGNAAPTGTSFQFGQSPAPQTNGFGGSTAFGGFGQQNGITSFGDSTPKATTPIVFEDNPTPKPSNTFGSAQSSNNLFGSAPTTNGFTFGQKPAEPSQASSTTFGGFGTQNTATQPEKPTNNGWSSFLNGSKTAETPKPTTNGFTPSTTSLFGSVQTNGAATTNGSGTPSLFAGLNSQAKTPTFNFTPDNDASMMSPENTPQKTNGATSQTETVEPSKSKSLFERITRSPPKENVQPAQSLFGGTLPPAAPKMSLFATQPAQSTPAPPAQLIASAQPAATPAKQEAKSSLGLTKPEHYASFRELNESLMQHLKTQDLSKDLSSIFQYYQTEAAKIVKSAGTGMGNSVLGKTIAEKPAESLYPKLPETASNTAKFFQAALDTPATSTNDTNAAPAKSSFTPTTTSMFGATSGQTSSMPAPAASLFGAKPASAPSTSLFGAKPAAPATNGFTPSTTSLFTPKAAEPATSTGGFKPTTTANGSSFLSSFGAAAAKNEAKEKRKRRDMDDDYDSDEEGAAEEWEKRDAEEQAAKRKKIEDAAKSASSFSIIPPSTAPSTSVFAGFGKPSEAKKDEDHTWKQGTPIKFGAEPTSTTTPAAAPKFSLFGAAAATPSNGTSLFASAAKPAFGFGQPSAAMLAASTPADSSEQPEEGDAAPPEPQLDDLAVLLPSEKDENDVLLSIALSKSRKLESRPSEGGTDKMTWIDKGRGPIWVLRNKTTGKTRVLQKIQDSGRAAMNFTLLKGDNLYKHEGMNGKCVMGTFIDHLGKDGSKPSSWAIVVSKKEDAAELASILRAQANL